MKLELHATPEEVMRAVEALREFLRGRQIDDRTLFGLTLALEECGSNIVNHAYQHDARQLFWVTFALTGGVLTIELRDRGPDFDPALRPERVAQPGVEESAPGGWGIHFVRHYTDEICHARVDGENILTLTKRINPPAATQ